jgi:hypothetical protein
MGRKLVIVLLAAALAACGSVTKTPPAADAGVDSDVGPRSCVLDQSTITNCTL